MIDWLRAVAWSLALLFLIGVLTLLAWAYWAGDQLRRYRSAETEDLFCNRQCSYCGVPLNVWIAGRAMSLGICERCEHKLTGESHDAA